MAFGGKSWPIDPTDMNLGAIDRAGRFCVGGIFDLSLGSNIEAGSGNPSWVIGDVFLVRHDIANPTRGSLMINVGLSVISRKMFILSSVPIHPQLVSRSCLQQREGQVRRLPLLHQVQHLPALFPPLLFLFLSLPSPALCQREEIHCSLLPVPSHSPYILSPPLLALSRRGKIPCLQFLAQVPVPPVPPVRLSLLYTQPHLLTVFQDFSGAIPVDPSAMSLAFIGIFSVFFGLLLGLQ